MANLQDRSLYGRSLPNRVSEDWPGSAFYDPGAVRAIQQKVDLLAAHMQKQLQEHEAAMVNTHRGFEYRLRDQPTFGDCFKDSCGARLPEDPNLLPRISMQADPDRS